MHRCIDGWEKHRVDMVDLCFDRWDGIVLQVLALWMSKFGID